MKQLFCILAAVILCSGVCLSEKIIRVPQDQPTIQAGINAAVNGDTVLVSEGTYTVNLLITKKIVLGSLYMIDKDTSHISKTILDGSAPTHSDSGTVVVLASGTDFTTLVTGFTITKGTGMRLPWGSNNTRYGGGVVITERGGGTIRKNTVNGNTITVPAGYFGGAAGIAVWSGDLLVRAQKAIIENNIIESNNVIPTTSTSVTEIGGIGAFQGYCRITGNIIRNNRVQWINANTTCVGGGICIASEVGGNDSMIVVGNTVVGNRTRQGGGIAVAGNGVRGVINGNTVMGNTGDYAGGGILLIEDLTGTSVTNNYISGNTSPRGGGIRIASTGSNFIANNIITKNTASSIGGGLSLYNSSGIQLVNNTIADNVCVTGHAISHYDASPTIILPKVMNCILWGTGASTVDVTTSTGKQPEISYSLVKGGYTGESIIDTNPLFTPNDTLYRLADNSPCIGAGIRSANVGGVTLTAPLFDYLNTVRPRAAGTRPDMGAIESDAGIAVRRVPQDYAKIQDAINASAEKDIVLVSDGIYSENLIINKKITLASLFFQEANTSHISNTILDGGSPGNADSASVIRLLAGTDTNTVITGLTIQNGKGTKCRFSGSLGTSVGVYGGGVVGIAGGATITHNIIKNNQCISSTVGVGAAGIDLLPSSDGTIKPSPWFIAHNTIENNTSISTAASTAGWAEAGGVDLAGDGKFINNVVKNNSVSGSYYGYGGGMYVYSFAGETDIQISNNLIKGNLASTRGGGIFSGMTPGYNLRVTCSNNIIAANSATNGSAISINGGDYEVVNNTVTGNTGTRAIYPMSATGPLAFRLLNNILWNPGTSSEFYSLTGVSASYNCVRGGITGTGNIDTDPLFVPGDTLYRLEETSPCICGGIYRTTVGGTVLTAPRTDYLGNARPRPIGMKSDLGAIEHDSGTVLDPTLGVKDISKGVLPASFVLDQNYPNPFNPSTTIRFTLPHESNVRLTVYNLLGQEVQLLVNERLSPGIKQVTWDAETSSGIYFYRLEAVEKQGARFTQTRQMMLVR